jgi:uncharacterized protein (DUF3084 family)
MSGIIEIITICLILMVAGGFIAWLGDRLGTYVGKKRLSKFGLRPRHTAMLYTILSGIVIALSTFFLLIWLNYGFRNALLHGRALDQQIARQKSALQSLTGENQDLQNRIVVASAAAEAALKDKLVADQKRDFSLKSLEKAQSTLVASRAALVARQKQLTAANEHLTAVEGNLNSSEADLRLARQNVANATVQVNLARGSYQHEQQRVEVLKQIGTQLVVRNGSLQHQNEDLEAKNTELITHDIILRKGEEVGRIVISTDQSVDNAQKQLNAWLRDLNANSQKLGASNGANGRTILIIPPGDSAVANSAPEEDAVNGLAHSISLKKGLVSGVVVVAEAKFNTFVGEQTKIELHPYDNVLAFTKDQEIASQTIDGSQSDEAVLNSLVRFLKSSVRPIAAHEGIIPIYDRKTQQFSYGEPVETSWGTIVKEIQQAGSHALVTAVANEDTYTSGPLKIRLIVKTAASQYSTPMFGAPELAPAASVGQGLGNGQ